MCLISNHITSFFFDSLIESTQTLQQPSTLVQCTLTFDYAAARVCARTYCIYYNLHYNLVLDLAIFVCLAVRNQETEKQIQLGSVTVSQVVNHNSTSSSQTVTAVQTKVSEVILTTMLPNPTCQKLLSPTAGALPLHPFLEHCKHTRTCS